MKAQVEALEKKIADLRNEIAAASLCPSDMATIGSACIDLYEGSVDETSRLGALDGRDTTAKALSLNRLPQTRITWFQAARACSNAGKRLCTRQEWIIGVTGTPDPGASGANEGCNVGANGALVTGNQTQCRSAAGIFDGIGNVGEWVDEWYVAGAPAQSDPSIWEAQLLLQPWGALSTDGKDGTWNLNGRAFSETTGNATSGLPAAAVRGGDFRSGESGGLHALDLRYAPHTASLAIGFRCCLTRGVRLATPAP
jgi:formylglycine-generating enzyme required for sulfatase activity